MCFYCALTVTVPFFPPQDCQYIPSKENIFPITLFFFNVNETKSSGLFLAGAVLKPKERVLALS